MIIAFDAREAFADAKTGKGRWSIHLLRALREHADLRITLLCDASPSGEWQGFDRRVFPSGIRWHMAAARFLTSADIDAYVSPTSFIVPWIVGGRLPVLQVVHDMIAFRDDPHDRKATLLERLMLPRVAGSTAHVACVSDATKRDLLERFASMDSSNVSVVHAGPTVDVPADRESDGRTILCPGTLCPRKNQLRLIDAYERLPDSVRRRFILTLIGGRGWDDDEIVERASAVDGVEWKGYVSDDEYAEALSTCHALAFPSLYEGFGFPVLDAMRIGVPVLTSDRGSLGEVAGDAALVVDPESVDALSEGLSRLLTDDALRARLSRSGIRQAERFTWAETARHMKDALQSIV